MDEKHAMKDKAQGKFREVKGAASGNTAEEMKGKMQGMRGDIQHHMAKGRQRPTRIEVRGEARRG